MESSCGLVFTGNSCSWDIELVATNENLVNTVRNPCRGQNTFSKDCDPQIDYDIPDYA